MNNIELIDALERVNYEYLCECESESHEEILGRRIIKLIECVPFHMIRFIQEALKNRSVRQVNELLTTRVDASSFFYAKGAPVTDRNGAVYTCVTSGYDRPFEPLLTSKELDYFLFTDEVTINQESAWKRIEIMSELAQSKGNFANRYYKFHSAEFFSSYDYSVYVDGNVQIISDITCLYNAAHNSKLGIAMHRHATRNCCYADAKWCLNNNRGNANALKKQIDNYKKEGLPENYGLCEATIIVIDQSNPISREIMDAWWKEFCRSKSGRDQISFPYVLWKMGYTIDDIGCLGNDEYHNPKFRINAHKGKLV